MEKLRRRSCRIVRSFPARGKPIGWAANRSGAAVCSRKNPSSCLLRCTPVHWHTMGKAGFLLLAWALLCICAAGLERESPTVARTKTLIKQLGTGNIREEDAAKRELVEHPSAEALPVLLKALPSSAATVQNDILDILDAYADPRKIPVLIAFRWRSEFASDSRIDSQLSALGAAAVDPLLRLIPEQCGANDQRAEWVGSVLGRIEPEGVRALLSALASGEPCKQQAARLGLVTPRPISAMAPTPTEDDDAEDAGKSLLVEAAEDENPHVQASAATWIATLKKRKWQDLKYSQFIEALIATYRSEVTENTQLEIARLLATAPCARVDRFMRAAVRAPKPEVRAIAIQYLSPASQPSRRR